MSAIFGIINKTGEAVNEIMAAKMQQSLLHRAIDGKNMYINGEVMLGHHKLIVHRRQTYEQQPFEYGDCVITCDARIDNIEELCNKLDLVFSRNITDSLIILNAYKKWGNDCVNYLEGDFAFAIWNKLTKTFYGASDHIGFRTFYYYENDKIFAFASEIKGIESIKTEPLEINEEIFFDYYTNIHHPITYDKKICVLQSAHYLLLTKKSKLTIKQYWLAKINNKYKFKHAQDWYDCLLKLITKKIENQIDSDYPIGIMLSGGLDSSLVSAIACRVLKEQNRKLIAFSSVLPDNYKGEDEDERFYIEKLKEHFDNLEVHYVSIPEQEGPYSNLNEVFEKVELPINIFHYVESNIYECANKLNVRTLLSGLGGDMTISHTGTGVIYDYLRKFKILKALGLFVKKHHIENYSLQKLIRMEILGHHPLYRRIGDVVKKRDYSFYPLKKEMIKKIIRVNRSISGKKKYYQDSLNKGEMCSTLLRFRSYATSFNLEFLSPIMDKKITDLYFDIPGELHLSNGVRRSFIKETMKNLVPQEIIKRTDKWPFSPDMNMRASAISLKKIAHLFKNKDQIEKITSIDFELLSKMTTQISQSKIKTEWVGGHELLFVPTVIIAAEFYLWLIQNREPYK